MRHQTLQMVARAILASGGLHLSLLLQLVLPATRNAALALRPAYVRPVSVQTPLLVRSKAVHAILGSGALHLSPHCLRVFHAIKNAKLAIKPAFVLLA
jgi:hypothetical protein